jgi:LysM domain-containing protein
VRAMGILCGSAALSLILVQAEAMDGMPAQPKALPAASAAADEAPAEPGGLLKGPATVARHWSKYQCPNEIPDGATYYIIVRGDTLWDISKRFLRNPYLWPQIWNANRCITDAHWIYPGDPLIIPDVAVVTDRAGEAGDDTGMETEEERLKREAEGRQSVTDPLIPAIEETALQCAHYVVDDHEDESLHIVGSEDGATKNAFAERDILYLNKGSNSGVKAGDVYSLQHVSYTVKHPDTNRTIGIKVEVTGRARVILVQENSATVTVEQACMDIHVGDYLKPYEKMPIPLIARHAPPDRLTPSTGRITGTVVDIAEDLMIAGERQLVTVNVGSDNGIAPGNLFTVYKIMYPSVPTARNVIGELVVVAVREKTATARVLYSRDAIMNGDKAELR